ncbi:DUF1501 domain-containing protein [Humisphaera borealis]|uniref:DUF1501 domain-containing protein n=1 Tax=Humisphaera borealis TaxID=2807512 RepID=A0A7M2WYJ7_9BACT|nr:DUF1501 domain-containing protein [Humisphaera borealis]QOV90587.1 DUF1501 domain-containing protein [Humisphaera borealis]
MNPSPTTRRDGIRRRDVLHLGMLSCLGLSFADVLRLRSAGAADSPAKRTAKAKSCIVIWLDGGPSHIDTFDPKPDAPAEVRGDFKAISTAVDGIRICEHLPLTAGVMKDVAVIRSVTHELGNHDTGSHFLLTGHRPTPVMEFPSLGSLVARQRGFGGALPPYLAIPGAVRAAGPGYFPGAFAPFSVGGDPSKPDYSVRDLIPPEGVTFDRVDRRREMLGQLDGFSRQVEQGPATASRDAFYEQAYTLMTSPAAKAALDLSQEPQAVRQRYGRNRLGASCLFARRLVEAGAGFVTVIDKGWDNHQQIFRELPDSRFPGSGKLPSLDRAYAALIDDLRERGLLDSTLVVLMGEFGRTPKINSSAGRDHWPRAGFACLAGGGVKGGQVIGATDAWGQSPIDTPVSPEDLACSILTLLGIDPTRQYTTADGRPIKILDAGRMVPGLV